jgi:hypothetical protein
MNLDLKYPQWQNPLAAAILEFDPHQLVAKLQRAEDAIANRIQEIAPCDSNQHERRLLFDGLLVIRGVRKSRLGRSSDEVSRI